VNSTGACKECREAEAAKRIPETVKVIGEEVVIDTRVGRGYDQTAHSFHQCANCGSVWVTYVDSGAGGHGRFHERLTKSFF
jgi:signal recognition particle GTPase